MRPGAISVLLALCVATSAFAQAGAPVGFKVGDGRLHLLGELDSRFDSLVGYFSSQGVPSPEIMFVPRLGLSYTLETPSTLVKFGEMPSISSSPASSRLPLEIYLDSKR